MPRKTPQAPSERQIRFQDTLRLGAILVAALIVLFIIAVAAHAFLILFAGLLLGVLLDACVRALRLVLPIGRLPALAASCIVLAGLLAGAVTWGGYQLVVQAEAIVSVMSDQLEAWQDELSAVGLGEDENEAGVDEETTPDMEAVGRVLIPEPEDWAQQIGTAFTTTFGVVGDLVIFLFAGIFVAANPRLYRNALLAVVPIGRRPRVGSVLDEIARLLRWWLIGQLVAMALVGTTIGITLALIGVPSALLLGLQAGLLTFIPYIGPLIAIVPVGLVALSQSLDMFIWAVSAYLAVQMLEGYLLTPLIHEKAIRLAPLFTLGALMIFGILFGAIGVILAMPLTAAIRILVIRFYIEDVLGDRYPERAGRS